MSAWHWLLYLIILSASLALHEIGHWAELRRLRIPMVRITIGLGPSVPVFGRLHLGLFLIGASVSPDSVMWRQVSAFSRFRVAMAGPVASFTCAAILLALGFIYPNASKGLSAFATLHFAIGAFNMIPIPPLDGWHILTELLASYERPLPQRATELAQRVGNGLIYGMGFWYVGYLLIGY